MPCGSPASQSEGKLLAQPFREIGLKQLLHIRSVHPIGRHELDAGIDPTLYRLSTNVRPERLDPEVAHLDGVLNDQSIDLAGAQSLHEVLRGVEADEANLACPPVVLQHTKHREGDRLVRAEDAVNAEPSIGRLEAAE